MAFQSKNVQIFKTFPKNIMRQKFYNPLLSGVLTPIAEIEVPTNSRSRIYPTLIALQEVYKRKPEVVDLVFHDLLKDYTHLSNDHIEPILDDLFSSSLNIPSDQVESEVGAPGMTAWQCLVAVALRQATNSTYDDLEVHFNHNQLLREFCEIPKCDHSSFSESRLGKNCRKISSETIRAINQALVDISVEMGVENGKEVRGDSFCCKTNIHHPSDTKAIAEASYKVINICIRNSNLMVGWRQYKKWIKQIKRLCRELVQAKRSNRKDKVAKSESIRKAYKNLIDVVRRVLEKVFLSWEAMAEPSEAEKLGYYMCCLEMMIDLAERRTQNDEVIESSEKTFSIFEPHTELIHRGKFPTPIEYGHRVFVAEGKSGIILDHRVMENGVLDQHETMPILERLFQRYGKLDVLSLDKGYNIKGFDPHKQTGKVLLFALASKGYKNKEKKKLESSTEFVEARKWRAGVESCIGALMRGNGADLCRDKHFRGYDRWVSACVLSRNLITLGRILVSDEHQRAA